MRKLILSFVLIFVSACFIAAQQPNEADATAAAATPKTTILVDEFGKLGECDRSARLDNFLIELQNDPIMSGYIVTYQPADLLPSQYQSGAKMFQQYIAFRKFDASRITIIQGFRNERHTQLWMVPPGGEIPQLEDSLPAPVTPKGKTYLFDRLDVDDFAERFTLDSVKALREQESERATAEDDDDASNGESADIDNSAIDPDAEARETFHDEYYRDLPADLANEEFAQKIAENKKNRGVIIFYLDDRVEDQNKVHALLDSVANELAKSGNISRDRFEIKFGGYRSGINFEMWVVPEKGSAPLLTPDERLPESPELTDN